MYLAGVRRRDVTAVVEAGHSVPRALSIDRMPAREEVPGAGIPPAGQFSMPSTGI